MALTVSVQARTGRDLRDVAGHGELYRVVQIAPGMLAALTAWFRLSDNTALRTGSARWLRTSA